MRPDEWWKNFSLGWELDVSGSFIYNGLRALDRLDVLYYAGDIFEILYQLSIGLERLMKVAIILLEHDNAVDVKEFEKGLMTHSTIDLADRVGRQVHLDLAPIHRQFLSLLSEFYSAHRYGRYSPASIPAIDAEKQAFLRFLEQHLDLDLPAEDSLVPLQNSNQIRRFVGRLVKKVSRPVFEAIRKRAHELNIYTYELRGDSKAIKVYWGEQLDFVDEDRIKREILLFLMNPDSSGGHLDLLRSFVCLDLDSALAPDHVRALLNDSHLESVRGEVEELYNEIDNVKKRFEMLAVMDQNLWFDDGHEDDEDEDQ